jgi:hypothetical protein
MSADRLGRHTVLPERVDCASENSWPHVVAEADSTHFEGRHWPPFFVQCMHHSERPIHGLKNHAKPGLTQAPCGKAWAMAA